MGSYFIRLKNGLTGKASPLLFILFFVPSVVIAGDVNYTGPHHPLDRILSEIHFARQLAAIYPEKAKNWDNIIQQAENLIYAIAAQADQTKVKQSIQEADRILVKLNLSKGKTKSDIKKIERKIKNPLKRFIAEANFFNYYMPNYQSRRDLNRAKSLVFDTVSNGREQQILGNGPGGKPWALPMIHLRPY